MASLHHPETTVTTVRPHMTRATRHYVSDMGVAPEGLPPLVIDLLLHIDADGTLTFESEGIGGTHAHLGFTAEDAAAVAETIRALDDSTGEPTADKPMLHIGDQEMPCARLSMSVLLNGDGNRYTSSTISISADLVPLLLTDLADLVAHGVSPYFTAMHALVAAHETTDFAQALSARRSSLVGL